MRCRTRECGGIGAAGFALPIVLIVLALLTTLALGLSKMVSSRIQDLQLRKELWQTEKQAIDLVHLQLYALLTGEYSQNTVKAGDYRFYLDGREMTDGSSPFTLQNAAGLYSLALYSEKRFTAFLRNFTDADTARHLSAVLGDWIDTDSQTRFRGMEAAAYISSGRKQLPRNGKLRSVEELLHLPSMTKELFYGEGGNPGLRDMVLAGGSSHFNISTAPVEVLGPMLGVSRSLEGQLLSAREREDWGEMRRLINIDNWVFGGASPFFPGFRYVFTYGGDTGRVIRVQVRLTPFGPALPYQIIEWQTPYFGHG